MTIAALPLIMTVASTAFTVMGSLSDAANAKASSRAQQNILNMQAAQAKLVSDRNATMLQDQKNYDAAQQESQANSAAATGQRASIEEQRKMRLAQSRAQAVGAASGAGALDPTALNIDSKIAGEGTYNALTQLYAGDTEAQSLKTGAALSRYEGKTGAEMTRYGGAQDAQNLIYQGNVARAEGNMAAQSARMKAAGSLFSGASNMSMMSKYSPTSSSAPKAGTGWVDWNNGGSTYYG